MSGHSKWSTIKRKKGKTDAVRGKLFSKLSKEIMSAAKIGGGDPDANPRLRLAIDKAKAANMPNDNIKRAVAKGAGGGDEANLEAITYEGYGPSGVAVMVDVLTDNKNRAISEIRNIFSKCGGNLGEAGCVSWVFKRKGLISIEKGKMPEDKIVSEAIDAGADDIEIEESMVEVVTDPAKFEDVRNKLAAKKIEIASAEVTMVPQNTVKVTGDDAHKVLKLVGELEEQDDVQAVHANFDIPDEIIEEESGK